MILQSMPTQTGWCTSTRYSCLAQERRKTRKRYDGTFGMGELLRDHGLFRRSLDRIAICCHHSGGRHAAKIRPRTGGWCIRNPYDRSFRNRPIALTSTERSSPPTQCWPQRPGWLAVTRMRRCLALLARPWCCSSVAFITRGTLLRTMYL